MKRRIGMGAMAAVAAISLLCSCARDDSSLEELEYVTIEFTQVPAERRELSPTIYIDLPKGFQFRGSDLVDGFVADQGVHWFEFDVEDLQRYGIKGLHWNDKSVALSVSVTSVTAVKTESDADNEPGYLQYMDQRTHSSDLTLMHPVVRGRTVEFGDYDGSVFYSRIEEERMAEVLAVPIEDRDPNLTIGPFECCIGLPVEAVRLGVSSEEYWIVVEAYIYGVDNSMPEMMDIVVRIAESIRIKE